jgi:hypothetical protein
MSRSLQRIFEIRCDESVPCSRADCASAGGTAAGAYLAAMQHCTNDIPKCSYAPPFGCSPTLIDCSQPACCGPACSSGNTCKDAIYIGATTYTPVPTKDACGLTANTSVTGVLCCR